MTRDECKRQAMASIKVDPHMILHASAAADKWLEPYDRRDTTILDGKGFVDQIDPETGVHSPVEVQLHAPRPVQPFNFGMAEVRALAREIRRELKL